MYRWDNWVWCCCRPLVSLTPETYKKYVEIRTKAGFTDDDGFINHLIVLAEKEEGKSSRSRLKKTISTYVFVISTMEKYPTMLQGIIIIGASPGSPGWIL